MSNNLPSLPPYPKGPEPELPPPRKRWRIIVWILLLLSVAAIVYWYVDSLASGIWVLAFVPQLLPCMGIGLVGFIIALMLLFIYLGQRYERHDR